MLPVFFNSVKDEIAAEEWRNISILILTFWSLVKIMFLLRTGALDSPQTLRMAFSGLNGVSQVAVTFVCMILSYVVYFVLSKVRSVNTGLQIAVAVLCTVGFVFALSAYGHAMQHLGIIRYQRGWTERVRETLIYGWAPFTLFSSAVFTLIKSNEARRRERQAARLEIAVRDAQLRAIRYQIDPHLLFNSLNSISAMVLDKRNDQAESMLLRLARYFRYSLTLQPADDITLELELELQSQYLEIERVRFGDALRLTVDIPVSLRHALVPSFILQPLVENAVKHRAPDALGEPLALHVRARSVGSRLCIEVENRGGRAQVGDAPSTGTGLRNVRERLELRFEKRQSMVAEQFGTDGYRVEIVLPLAFAA